MKKAYFISDLHLGATYNDDDKSIERSVVNFLDSIKEDAAEIFLLGDILDYWYEYKYVVPRGFVRFFGKLAELSDSGISITWIIGNHDIWIFDYLPSELGIEVVDGILEKKVLGTVFSMQHGDAIGGNRQFRFLRALFRNRFCQFLYSSVHPRWTVGFANGWSRHSRTKRCDPGIPKGLLDKIRDWCNSRIASGDPAQYFVFGHLHRQSEEVIDRERHLIVVPDWISRKKYGVFDGQNFRILEFS